MTLDKNDREPPRDTTDGGDTEDKSTQENGDWITELEQELEEISKKWFGSRSQG